jgi:hypothetical protein
MITGFSEKGHEQEGLDRTLYQDLAKWEGIVAWTDTKAEVKDGHVVTDATGYFEDANKLGQEQTKVTWKKNADGFALTWTSKRGAAEEDPFGEAGKAQMAQARPMMQMFKGLKFEAEFVLPGTVVKTTTKSHEGRTAGTTITDADVIEIFDLQSSLQQKIDAGETTKEKATAELDAKTSVLNRIEVTCSAASGEDELAQFQKDLAAAKASYKDSGLSEKIAKLKKEAKERAAMEAEGK